VSSNSLPPLPQNEIKAEQKVAEASVPEKEIVMPETVEDQISYYTQKAGDLSRQLGLAGIAVIWLFKVSSGSVAVISQQFSLPFALIISSLGLDLLQYFAGIVLWGGLWLKDQQNATRSIGGFKLQVVLMIVIAALKVAIMLLAYLILLCRLPAMVHFG
jgi:hypothetical protein